MDENGWGDIGYHFAIDENGVIYQGRILNVKGEHVKGKNAGKIGIVLLTDLDAKNSGLNVVEKVGELFNGEGDATDPMVESLITLIGYLRKEYGIEYLGGHQEVSSEERPCPGERWSGDCGKNPASI